MEKLCGKSYAIGVCLFIIVIVTAILLMSYNSKVCGGWLNFNCPENETQETGSLEIEYRNSSPDDIVISSPQHGTTVSFPLQLSGQARGPWFSGASAPVRLMNESGDFLITEKIEAQGEWMTEDFVSFTGQIDFEATPGNYILLFQSSNPSDLPELDKFVEVPIVVK